MKFTTGTSRYRRRYKVRLPQRRQAVPDQRAKAAPERRQGGQARGHPPDGQALTDGMAALFIEPFLPKPYTIEQLATTLLAKFEIGSRSK
jgi:hypothetical protein